MGLAIVCLVLVLFCVLVLGGHSISIIGGSPDVAFSDNYNISWGGDHVTEFDQGRTMQLNLDNRSGSGFQSKMNYGSGLFSMKIKLPSSESTAGVVTSFYLITFFATFPKQFKLVKNPGPDKVYTNLVDTLINSELTSRSASHDELDFEFLGNLKDQPIILQTNVFVNGEGKREERIQLWFRPSDDYHLYKILWNTDFIGFLVDDIPIRVYTKNQEKGVQYPTQAMQAVASVWNGESWATGGGIYKIDWLYSPFTANFTGFSIDGCASNDTGLPSACDSSAYWWNRNTNLTEDQWAAYQDIRSKYLIYDYCDDRVQHPVPPPQCPQMN